MQRNLLFKSLSIFDLYKIRKPNSKGKKCNRRIHIYNLKTKIKRFQSTVFHSIWWINMSRLFYWNKWIILNIFQINTFLIMPIFILGIFACIIILHVKLLFIFISLSYYGYISKFQLFIINLSCFFLCMHSPCGFIFLCICCVLFAFKIHRSFVILFTVQWNLTHILLISFFLLQIFMIFFLYFSFFLNLFTINCS